MLRSTALDIGAPGRDFLAGDGLIDAEAALDAVRAADATAARITDAHRAARPGIATATGG